ncbi:MAG: hypothetical protein ACHQIO_07315 [Nevskiales bacterium]
MRTVCMLGLAAALTVPAVVSASAEERWEHHGGWGGGHDRDRGGWGDGGGIGVGGVLLGLGVGAALGAAIARPPVYYAPPPVYYAPPPVVYYGN